ncbi:MAG: T9SS type A sorting domain-containing protein [Candidatus Eisenbacteria bacterium]|nr:T9SS type A sorting domain-containing protein [Candidatus Latescibacterota bacterium]MBD3301480.1 T9SS type A sorting domain-containing protein [Candidatus Eisenbacteria bacterium]
MLEVTQAQTGHAGIPRRSNLPSASGRSLFTFPAFSRKRGRPRRVCRPAFDRPRQGDPMMFRSQLLRLSVPLFALAAMVAGSWDGAQAHLSIIRQGAESAEISEPGDLHGHAFAAGDFNGDGRGDLATGAPDEGLQGETGVGIVTVNLGSAQGLTHVEAFTLDPSDFGVPLDRNQRFGFALAAADLNDDNFADLVVGAPGEEVNGYRGAGRIYIYAGSPSGLQPWVSYVQQDLDGVSLEFDLFGSSLVTGNFNNDTHEDIAIGSPSRGVREGTVFIVYGAATGPFGGSDLFTAEKLGASIDIEDHFGLSLAAGNVIGNTRGDLVVGAPYREAFGLDGAGVCYVIPGTDDGLTEVGAVAFTAKIADDVSWAANFGYSLATVKSGVYDQVAVGEPGRIIGSLSSAGRVLVVTGSEEGPDENTTVVLVQDMFGVSAEEQDEFGTNLAAGYFEEDSFMDLAIGTPKKDFGGVGNAGMAHIILGGTSGLGSSGYYIYGQNSIGEAPEVGDHLGSAVAFGAFDATGQGTLVIGASGENGERGLVHVVAPWRQFYWQGHKTAFVTDCQNQIIFSQKPFDQILIASTTKIMTILIACERTQLPPDHADYVSLGAVYTVPGWIPSNVGGSSADLIQGEQLTLESLMYLALLISANDAAHAIADLLHGSNGPEESIPAFVNEMNARAQELGMLDTHFNNPNGFEQEAVGPDLGDHYSTAYDMALLSRAAMANERFRAFSNTDEKTVLRLQYGEAVLYNFQSFQNWILNNMWGLNGSGIKGGWTPAADETWCVSAEGTLGRAIATTFGTDKTWTPEADAGRLLTLGIADCATWQPIDDWSLDYLRVVDDITARSDEKNIFSMNPTTPYDMQIDLFHATADVAETDALMHVRRTCEVGLDPAEVVPFGVAPFEAHDDIVITNLGETAGGLLVQTPNHEEFYYILPGESITIPASEGDGSDFQWTIRAGEDIQGEMHLAIEEDYLYDVVVPAIPSPDPIFSSIIQRGEETSYDLVALEIDWRQDGNDYVMAVHEPGVTVDAPEPPRETSLGKSILQLYPPSPNPSSSGTDIRFALLQRASVGISIFDASGRRVRHYPATERSAGMWTLTWDGESDGGTSTAPGIYFYQVQANGSPPRHGKLIRIR